MKRVIPSSITLASLFFGGIALFNFTRGNIPAGCAYLGICILLDGADGFMARKLGVVTRFGTVFDLLIDYLTFGWFLLPFLFQKSGINLSSVLVAIVFVSLHAVRVAKLIRSNGKPNTGMPDLLNAFIIPIGYCLDWNLNAVFLVCAILMVAPMRFPKPSEFQTR